MATLVIFLLTGCPGTKVNFEMTAILQRDSTAVTGDADYKSRSPTTNPTATPPLK